MLKDIKDILNKIKEDTSEAKQVGTIYHYTNAYNAYLILRGNKLVSNTGYISFTRDPRYHQKFRHGVGTSIALILDGDRLSNNYKIEPHDFRADKQARMMRGGGYEAEERIPAREIGNLRDYLQGIRVVSKEFMDNPNDLIKLAKDLGLAKSFTNTTPHMQYDEAKTRWKQILKSLVAWFEKQGIGVEIV